MANFRTTFLEKLPEVLDVSLNATIATINSVATVVPNAVDKTVKVVGTTTDMLLDYLNAGNELSSEFLDEFKKNKEKRERDRAFNSETYYTNSIMSKIEETNKYPENIRYEIFLSLQRRFGQNFVHWDNQNKVIVLHKLEG